MKNIGLLLGLLLVFNSWMGMAQDQYPDDFLPKDFHQNKREELRQLMPENSVAVFFANPVRNRANDVDYVYHQDPDFYYLTGYKEPNSVLLIFKETQTNQEGISFNEVIFSQGRNPRRELYDGKRLGVKGVKALGFQTVYDANTFATFEVDFTQFDKVLFFDFKGDVRDNPQDKGDLYDLILSFKNRAEYPVDFNANQYEIYAFLKSDNFLQNPQASQILQQIIDNFPDLATNEAIQKMMEANTPEERKVVIESFPEPTTNLDATSLAGYMTQLREIKTPQEIDLLKKAVDISCIGQIEVMKAMHPDMSESEVQGLHEFVFKKYGAEYEGYPSIVGAGHNGCILHYIENDRLELDDDLVLMDLGAEYRGYTADVTRTIPANGQFSTEQKAIYDLVYEAQEAAFAICKPGTSFSALTPTSKQVISKGLAKLGIIPDEDTPHNYLPHGITHHIGLDVHDRGQYNTLQETW